MKLSIRNTYFVLSAISLICGATIYPLFRGPDLLVWAVIPKPDFWDMLRIPLSSKGGLLSIFIDSGPDCLWLLSGLFVLRGLWFFKRKTQTVYITLFYLIAGNYNLGQYFGIIPGTFDFIDVFTMSGVALIEAVVFIFFVKGRIQDEEGTV